MADATPENESLADIERCAALSASILHFGAAEQAEVLERLAEEPARYERSRDHWIAAMASELERGGDGLAKQFGVAFAAKKEALADSRPTLASLGPLRERVAPEPRPAALATPMPDVPVVAQPAEDVAMLPAPTPLEVPTYLRKEEALAVPTPAPPAILPLLAPPLAWPLAPPAPAPPAPVPRAAGPVVPSATEPINFEKLRKILLADPMPFLGKTTPARLAELKAAASESEETHFAPLKSSASTDVDVDETAMFMPSPADREKLQTLPFTRAPKAPELSVEQYAAMCAELQAKGPLPNILERYGVTDTSLLLALQAEQARRFEADPALRARFEEQKAHFMRFLRQGPHR